MKKNILFLSLIAAAACSSLAQSATQSEQPAATLPAKRPATSIPADRLSFKQAGTPSWGWKERHEEKLALVKQQKFDLVFIGDSITHCFEYGGQDVWAKHYAPRRALNLGYGGDLTQHVLWRLDHGELAGQTPKLAVVMIGTNNTIAKDQPLDIAAGIQEIVLRLQRITPDTKILLLGIFPLREHKNGPLRINNDKTNALIARFADDKRVFCLNINDKFLTADGTLTKEIMPDLVHPGPKGYQIWADAIEPTVAKLMGEAVIEQPATQEPPPGAELLSLSYDTPGDSSSALPVGNGDIGVQSWVESNGDLVMLIGKTDAWGEQCNLLKLGKVRLKFDKPLATGKTALRQTLDMGTGTLLIQSEIEGKKVELRVWVDANHPVVRVETNSDTPVGLSVALELWRKKRNLTAIEVHALDGLDLNEPVREWPDTVVDAPTGSLKNHLVWYHRNEHSVYPASLRIQEIEAAKGDDPLLNRTFGCALGGSGFTAKSPTLLVSEKPATRQTLTIHPFTLQTPSADGWLQALGEQTTAESTRDVADCYAAHVQWWRAFWQRSWVSISGGKPEEAKEIASINTGWHTHRYLIACTARGNSPIKFNGSIFNVEKYNFKGQPADWVTPDYRNWGSGFWLQNQRHLYWPMLAAGDHDQFAPFFKMYRDALPLAKKRTEIYYKHEGAYFPETMMFFGTWYNNSICGYGGNRKGKELGLADSEWIRRYWQGGIELSAMMLEYYRHTGDEAFVRETLLPIVTSIVTFYDQHYKRGADGKIRFSPAQMLESYWDADNPMPEIAGLRCVIPGLLALPENLTTADQRQAWRRMFGELPSVPEKTINGKTSLWDAQNIKVKNCNAENGRLYAVWPYRLFGVGLPEFDKAMHAWETRPFKYHANACWHNDIIWAAYLGMPDQARTKLGVRLDSKNFRFPAMFTHGDGIPDHDNGGVCQNTIQAMLMQTVGDRILLLPAWPKHWDVKFKLHAPKNTTVGCELRNGKIEKLIVTPESRRKDVEITH